jgi:phosphoglycolate phosphatase-like HAD superfamily hydrolase
VLGSGRRLILFDIDGTLMLSGGAGHRALTHCFREIFAIENALEGVRLHGQTDPQILMDALEKAGLDVEASRQRLAILESTYFERLELEIKGAPSARLMPGVSALLAELSACDGVHLGLVTGNFERGARIKLSRFDLNRYFAVGGFGSDSIQRRELVPIAIERAQRRFDVRFEREDVFVIGDTERDIDCGRSAGARTIAVATGGMTLDELAGSAPDHLLTDLSDTAHVLSLLIGRLGRSAGQPAR